MILLLILDCGVFSDVFITHHLWFNFWQVICSFLKIKCTVYCEMGWLSLLRVTKPSSKLVLHMQVYLQPSVAWSGLGGLSGLEVGLGRPRAASSGLERPRGRPRGQFQWPRRPRGRPQNDLDGLGRQYGALFEGNCKPMWNLGILVVSVALD